MSSRCANARGEIAAIARALGEDRTRVVFVGGTVTALYPLDGGADVRPTVDVDCVIDVTTTAEYYDFVDRLRARGPRRSYVRPPRHHGGIAKELGTPVPRIALSCVQNGLASRPRSSVRARWSSSTTTSAPST